MLLWYVGPSAPDLSVIGLRPTSEVDRYTRPIVNRHHCRELNLTAVVDIPAYGIGIWRRRQPYLIVELAQTRRVMIHDLVVHCVLCPFDRLDRAHEISPSELVIAQNFTCTCQDELLGVYRMCVDSILSDLITYGRFLVLSQLLYDFLLVLGERPLGKSVRSGQRRGLLSGDTI